MKHLLASALYTLYRILDPLFRFPDVSVLVYHSISEDDSPTSVSAEVFTRHLQHLKDREHVFVSLDEVVKGAAPKSVALTFDDGYADFETHALPIMEKFNAPCAVFVMGDREASRARLGNDVPLLLESTLEKLEKHPLVTIGYHGRSHADMRHLKGAPLHVEIARPEGMHYFAFAGGSYTHEALHVLENEGYAAAFSIKPGLITARSHRFLLQRNVILKGMTMHDVHLRVTRAIEWYARMARWFK